MQVLPTGVADAAWHDPCSALFRSASHLGNGVAGRNAITEEEWT